MTDEERNDENPDAEEHNHGPEEGDRPDDAVPFEPPEVGERMNPDDEEDSQLSTEDEDEGKGRE